MRKTFLVAAALVLAVTTSSPQAMGQKKFNQRKCSAANAILAEGWWSPATNFSYGATLLASRNSLESAVVYRTYPFENKAVSAMMVQFGYSLSGERAFGTFGATIGLNGVVCRWAAENEIFGFGLTNIGFKPMVGLYARGGVRLGPIVLSGNVGYGWTLGLKTEPKLGNMELTSMNWTAPALTAGVAVGFGNYRRCRYDGDNRIQINGGYLFGLGESQSALSLGMDWFKRLGQNLIGLYGVEFQEALANAKEPAAAACFVGGKLQYLFFDTTHAGSWLRLTGALKVGVSENYVKFGVDATCGDSNEFHGTFTNTHQNLAIGATLQVDIVVDQLMNWKFQGGSIKVSPVFDFVHRFPRGVVLKEQDEAVGKLSLNTKGRENQFRVGVKLTWTI